MVTLWRVPNLWCHFVGLVTGGVTGGDVRYMFHWVAYISYTRRLMFGILGYILN